MPLDSARRRGLSLRVGSIALVEPKTQRTSFAQFARLLRERRDLRRLWWSNVVSQLGDWLTYVAVSVVTLAHDGSATAIGLVMVAHTLPYVLVAPLAGPLADRLDRRKLLIGSYILCSLLTVGMWSAASAGAIIAMQVLLLGRVAISAIAATTRSAIVPLVVEPEELHTANALLSMTWSVLFAGGVALGGVLASLMGADEVILLDALTFLIAGLLVWELPKMLPAGENTNGIGVGLDGMRVAWQFAKAHPVTWSALLSKVPIGIAGAAVWVTLNLVAEERIYFLEAATALGLLHGSRAIGTGIGPMLPSRWLPPQANVGTPLMFFGVGLFVLVDHWLPSMIGVLCWGIGSGHNWVASTSRLQADAPKDMLGRVAALDFFLMTLAQSIFAVVSGLVIDFTGLPGSGALVGLALGICLWIWIRKQSAIRTARLAA